MTSAGRPSGPRLLAVGLLAAALTGGACRAGGDRASVDAATPTASSAPSRPAAPSSSSSAATPPPPRAMPLCRAASLTGAAKLTSISGGPLEAPTLAESSDIPEDAWIDLAAGGKLTARHPHSTRETTFVGPARVRSCVAHGQEAWLESGKFESVLAAGEHPGAEEWVVTPIGVVRYGVAKLAMVVGAEPGGAKVDVKVESGTAFAWTGDQAGAVKPAVTAPVAPAAPGLTVPDGWIRLDGPRTVTLTQTKTAKSPGASEVAQAAIDRCKVEAKAAKELAVAVATPDASLGRVAPKQVVARHLARAACSVALLRVSALPASATRDAFMTTLREAEADWKGRIRAPHGKFH